MRCTSESQWLGTHGRGERNVIVASFANNTIDRDRYSTKASAGLASKSDLRNIRVRKIEA